MQPQWSLLKVLHNYLTYLWPHIIVLSSEINLGASFANPNGKFQDGKFQNFQLLSF